VTFFDAENIKSVLGATWVARPDLDLRCEGVSTDTRTLRPRDLFVALRGDRFDGHRFLDRAAAAGALLALIDGPAENAPAGLGLLRVEDTRAALLRLASAYRRTLDSVRIVGVTGSNGKTTTKHLIHEVLVSKLRGSASPKSFNNAIGVPLTILAARGSDQYLVCEIGSNAPGEIAQLARVVQPDAAVITSIGRAHLEGFGSIEGVCREKASLLNHLRPGGVAVVTADAPVLRNALRAVTNLVTFGFAPDADLRVEGVEVDTEGVSFRINDRESFWVPLIGRHSALAATAAVAVGRRFGLDSHSIRAALAGATGASMRLERVRVGGVELINDAYNANPDSVRAALETLASLPGDRRVAVLGDMLELGQACDEAHLEIVEAVTGSSAIAHAVLVGPRLARAAAGADPGRVTLVEDLEGGRDESVASLLCPGDSVLLKGSRLMGLERVADALARRDAVESPPNPRAR
jgi:UDP-N-acetylmuramoyl-tripeptide--D-alanyl-D-alanine ligase